MVFQKDEAAALTAFLIAKKKLHGKKRIFPELLELESNISVNVIGFLYCSQFIGIFGKDDQKNCLRQRANQEQIILQLELLTKEAAKNRLVKMLQHEVHG